MHSIYFRLGDLRSAMPWSEARCGSLPQVGSMDSGCTVMLLACVGHPTSVELKCTGPWRAALTPKASGQRTGTAHNQAMPFPTKGHPTVKVEVDPDKTQVEPVGSPTNDHSTSHSHNPEQVAEHVTFDESIKAPRRSAKAQDVGVVCSTVDIQYHIVTTMVTATSFR